MVCGEFQEAYGGPAKLAQRLKDLEQRELISIRDPANRDRLVSANELADDALANNCYEDLTDTRDSRWDMVATDAGFTLIEERVGKQ